MRKSIFIVILSALAIAGCVEHQYIYKHKQAGSQFPYDVQVGDEVVIVLLNDQYQEFKVTEVTESEIVGQGVRVNYNDIAFVKEKEIDSGATTKSVLGATGAALLVVLTIFIGLLAAA